MILSLSCSSARNVASSSTCPPGSATCRQRNLNVSSCQTISFLELQVAQLVKELLSFVNTDSLLPCSQDFRLQYTLTPRSNFFCQRRNSPPVGQRLLIIEASRSHSDTPHSVGLLWTSDQPDAGTSTWQHNTRKRQTSMPSMGFEPAIPASERPQTHALGRAATGSGYLVRIGHHLILFCPSHCIKIFMRSLSRCVLYIQSILSLHFISHHSYSHLFSFCTSFS
jgi:hypothetical protein